MDGCEVVRRGRMNTRLRLMLSVVTMRQCCALGEMNESEGLQTRERQNEMAESDVVEGE